MLEKAARKTFSRAKSKRDDDRVSAPTPAVVLDNGRYAPRKALRSAAVLRFAGKRGQVSCLVLDISATGAKLRLQLLDTQPFDASMTVPQEFMLVLPNDHIEIDCKLAWRTENDIGVVFVSNFRPVRKLAKRSA